VIRHHARIAVPPKELTVRPRALSLPNTLRPTVALLTVALLAAGCGDDAATDVDTPPASQTPGIATTLATPDPSKTGTGGPATATAATPVPTATLKAAADSPGTFRPYAAGATAITYDTAVVPSGATATVKTSKAQTRAGTGVSVKLVVTGMKPRRAYGAHLHTDPCTATAAAAGPHYQHDPDPKAIASPPSVDPKFANPRNEVWLDFTTDAKGAATVTTTQAWPFDDISPPRSLIVHAQRTQTAAGKAGTAGARVACLTLPL
jgi:Cu-Zn family superoxide dismutase